MKRVLTDLKLPKLELTSSTVAIECHRYERLAVLKMFARLFCFEGVGKCLGKTHSLLVRQKRKTRQRLNIAFMTWKMPKLVQIREQSSVARQACRFFFSVHCRKQIDSMLPCICSVIDPRRRQNISDTLAVLFCPHLDVICKLIQTRRTSTWNLFVKWMAAGGC